MDYVQTRMTMIFDEWARRYSVNLNEWESILDENGQPIEGYGEQCATYFRQIATEMDEQGLLPKAPQTLSV